MWKFKTKGSIIIPNTQTPKEQFQTFVQQHKTLSHEKALELFTIFGGVEWGEIDSSQDTFHLVKKLILDDYRYIRNDISDLTTGMPLYHSILSGIALGDGRTHSAFKKAGVEVEVGKKAIDELCELQIITRETPHKKFTDWDKRQNLSDKLHFNTPFMKFWFAFISPLFKGIKDGDYKEIEQRFQNRFGEFVASSYTQLSLELLKDEFKDDPIVESGSYWEKDVDIDIYAKTTSGKIIVGTSSYSNTKMKKTVLTKLQELCKEIDIKADIYILSSKNGFSSELKSSKRESLKLFTLKKLSFVNSI